MDVMDALQDQGGVAAIARELGIDERTAHSGVSALLPPVMGGMQNQADVHPQGLGGLADILGGLGGGGLLGRVTAPEPTDPSAGNDVLGQIFGSKDTSRAVASDAAGRTGLSPDLLKRMLPLVAMLAAGYFSKQSGRGGLGGMLRGGSAGDAGPSGGGLGGMLGGLLGGKAAMR